jgi:hypothetical protein
LGKCHQIGGSVNELRLYSSDFSQMELTRFQEESHPTGKEKSRVEGRGGDGDPFSIQAGIERPSLEPVGCESRIEDKGSRIEKESKPSLGFRLRGLTVRYFLRFAIY